MNIEVHWWSGRQSPQSGDVAVGRVLYASPQAVTPPSFPGERSTERRRGEHRMNDLASRTGPPGNNSRVPIGPIADYEKNTGRRKHGQSYDVITSSP